jgi:hypothetical protein
MILYRQRRSRDAEPEDSARCDLGVRGTTVREYTLFGWRRRRPLRQCKGEAVRFFRLAFENDPDRPLFSVKLCQTHTRSEHTRLRSSRLRLVEITKAEYEADRHRAEQESAQAVSPRAVG